MPVAFGNRAGNTCSIVVTFVCDDIISGPGTAAEKKKLGLSRALNELSRAVVVAGLTDAEIDAQVAAATADTAADAAARKAARATGSL